MGIREVRILTVSKQTELGTISVSNLFYAQIIRESFEQESCLGKIWAATRKGRQIGSDQKFSVGEFASHIEAENSFDGAGADLEFSVIVRFGTSICKLTDDVCSYIAETLYEKQGRKPNQIKIHIVGVRSRQTARRSLEVIKRYAAD